MGVFGLMEVQSVKSRGKKSKHLSFSRSGKKSKNIENFPTRENIKTSRISLKLKRGKKSRNIEIFSKWEKLYIIFYNIYHFPSQSMEKERWA